MQFDTVFKILGLLLATNVLGACAVDISVEDKSIYSTQIDTANPNDFIYDENYVQIENGIIGLKPLNLVHSEIDFQKGNHLGISGLKQPLGEAAGDALKDIMVILPTQTVNLLGYWRMEGDWLDASGQENHFTSSLGSPAFDDISLVGEKSGLFDGSSSLQTAKPISLSNSDFTIAVWARAHNENANLILGQGGASLNQGLHFGYRNDGSFTFAFYGNDLNSPTLPGNRSWHHWVGTYEVATGTRRIYRDGRLVAGETGAAPLTATGPLCLGGYYACHQDFDGNIDELAIWKTVLKESDLSKIYASQKQKYLGHYESEIVDFGSKDYNWSHLSWKTPLPFGKPLLGDSDGDGIPNSDTPKDYPELLSTLNEGMVGYWPMDDTVMNALPDQGSGLSDFEDRGPHRHHGYDTGGGVRMGDEGITGGAASFDGVDDTIALTGNPDLPLYNHPEYTLSLWVKGHGTHNDRRIWAEGNSANTNPIIGLGTHGAGLHSKIRFYFRGDSWNVFLWKNSDAEPFDGKWHHILITDANGDLKLYVDGKRDTADLSYTRPANVTLDYSGIGGLARAAGGSFFNGSIDEVGMWKRILSPEEVQQVYRRSANRVKFQVRGCVDAECQCRSLSTAPVGSVNDCDGDGTSNALDPEDAHRAEFIGPGGDKSTYFSEIMNIKPEDLKFQCSANTADSNSEICTTNEILSPVSPRPDAPTFSLADYSSLLRPQPNRYFQYTAVFEAEQNVACDDAPCLPSLSSIDIGGDNKVHYNGAGQKVESRRPVPYKDIQSLRLVGDACVRIQISPGDGNFYFWKNEEWAVASDDAENSSIEDTQDNIQKFSSQFPNGNFYLRAFLGSDTETACQLTAIDLDHRNP